MTAPIDRLQTLEAIEKDIILCLQSAGHALLELSKDKSSLKQAESHSNQFLKTLHHVESKLTEQINYLTQVSTGQPHEGSGYASQKVLQMAWHRLEHLRSRVNELERNKQKQLQTQTRGMMRPMQQQQPMNQ
ncbi:mediator of RNA polymerase II transcription subunit 11 isoform X2 [Homalodisca vitripennis]|uniref:Mediator of RNA polymerase II transcription subunit 11 n=1 Tax=Homalodisca liturata TaxID=320908 RepID=A0A1B6IIM0_9HEMI|nr:mediator of RNA polymerase II transcription subunit 11 isoform X2 [Homalodisca vitripennis]